MRSRLVRILSAFFCIAIICTTVILTRVELHGAPSATLLFYNDRVWTQNTALPAEQMHSVYYAPISLFVQLSSVDVRMNSTLRTFIITHGDKYLSFDISTNFAANQDKERMYLKTLEFHDERYVPIEAVCQALGLGFETYTDPTTASVAIRISDSKTAMSLEQLAKSKYPGYFPETTAKQTESVTTQKDTTGKDTTDKDTAPVLSHRVIYIAVTGAPGEYTSGILELLSKYNCRATFFIDGNMAGERADAISAIAAGGHAFAIDIPSADAKKVTDGDAALSYVTSQNELLARIIKQKTHIVRSTAELGDVAAEQLESQGYVLWGATVDISPSLSASRAATQAKNAIWNNEIAVLCFSESRNTAAALESVLKFISQNKSVCEVRVITAALEN